MKGHLNLPFLYETEETYYKCLLFVNLLSFR